MASFFQQELNSSQLAAVARLFSSSVLQDMARTGKSPLFSRLLRESKLTNTVSEDKPLSNIFEVAFSLLKKKDYRHEYVYKAAIVHKVLLGKHTLKTASMLTEFRAGKCRADVAILNGTSTVYEIKSERDKLSRLQSQISAYRKVFARVNVITGNNHLDSVHAGVPSDVGILLLTDRFQISTVREAVNSPGRIEPGVVFDSLQLHEAKLVLEFLGIESPVVPNTMVYHELKKRFVRLDPEQAHAGMVDVLKRTRSLQPLSGLIESLPVSLRAAAFSTRLRKKDHKRLITAMDTPVSEALNWG